jgi:hypothetical protein
MCGRLKSPANIIGLSLLCSLTFAIDDLRLLSASRFELGGGVFIALHDNLTTSTVENSKNDCQLQWAEIQSKKKSAIIGSYYRPPNSNLDALNNLKSSIANVSEHSKDKPIILSGDFNLPHIDWETSMNQLLRISFYFGSLPIEVDNHFYCFLLLK